MNLHKCPSRGHLSVNLKFAMLERYYHLTDIWGKEIENLSITKAILHSCQQLERLEAKGNRHNNHVDEIMLE